MKDETERRVMIRPFRLHPSAFILASGAQGRTQTFNLWFVEPALHQLSYSGDYEVQSPTSNVQRPFGAR